jgi:hypothetical protein
MGHTVNESDARPARLEDAGLSADQAELIRKAHNFLLSTIFATPIYLGEPDELPFPEEPLVRRVVLTICQTARIELSDLPFDQPDKEFEEMANKWFKIKIAEDQEAAFPLFYDGPSPQSHTFRTRQSIKVDLWNQLVAKLRPPKSKLTVTEQPAIESPAPERGKKICPNPKCRKSVGSRRLVCSCGYRFPPKIHSPVKLARGERLCPDCYMACNAGRCVCPICLHNFRKKCSAIPACIAVLIQTMSSARRYQLQKAMRTFGGTIQKAAKRKLARLREEIVKEKRIDWRQRIYRKKKRIWERDDKLEYLTWLTVRVVCNDF